jgi:hypothetical protein
MSEARKASIGKHARALVDGVKQALENFRNGGARCSRFAGGYRGYAHVVIDGHEQPGTRHSVQAPVAAENGRMGSEPSQFNAAAAIAPLKR